MRGIAELLSKEPVSLNGPHHIRCLQRDLDMSELQVLQYIYVPSRALDKRPGCRVFILPKDVAVARQPISGFRP